jgi:uroporphyrinogen-III synthase
MRVLITRPQHAADRLAAELRTRGFEPVSAPMLDIVDTGANVELSGVQAVLASSANGVAALARQTGMRDVKLLAVGDATAMAARELGFPDVESAGGDSAALSDLAILRCDPAVGRLLHVAGGHVAGTVAETLRQAGFTVDSVILYDARTPEALTDDIARQIAAREIAVLLFYSPRTAETFVKLAVTAGLADDCATIDAVCLSPAVAEAAATIGWRYVSIAATPDGAALLAALEAIREKNGLDQR